MQNNGIREFARNSSCSLRKVPNGMSPKVRGGRSAARGGGSARDSVRLAVGNFLQNRRILGFARRASSRTRKTRNLQEEILKLEGKLLAKQWNPRICKKLFLQPAKSPKWNAYKVNKNSRAPATTCAPVKIPARPQKFPRAATICAPAEIPPRAADTCEVLQCAADTILMMNRNNSAQLLKK